VRKQWDRRGVQAWTFKLTGKAAAGVAPYGSLAATPMVQNGVVYLQDLDANVYALALATGKLEWECQFNAPERSGPGPNGVAVVDGTVYGETPTSAFALTAATGRTIWVNRNLLGKHQGTFGIQPQVANGRVHLASQYGSGPGGGVLIALKASSGALLWKFNTVVGAAPGVQSLGVGSGGAWETPLVSSDGSVTSGIGNPYQSPASAIAHPAAQFYTDSDVKLNAATGRLRWYYQGVPDDFKDYDMQASPISASTNGISVVIGSSKMGYVYEMNATKVPKLPLGAATVSNDLVFTTLFNGVLIALNRNTGAIAYQHTLPTSANAPIAIAGNTVIVPAGGPGAKPSQDPQLVAYTAP